MLPEQETLRMGSEKGDDGAHLSTLLIHIGQSHHLVEPAPRVIVLDQLEQLDLGRGEVQWLEATGKRTKKFLVDDPWMSGHHASLVRQRPHEDGVFCLQDNDSTNGCRANGKKVTSHRLRHGDIIETGRTFWKFHRARVERLQLLVDSVHRTGPVKPTSSASIEFLAQIYRLVAFAATDIPLIVLGESGSGKEVMTGEIHQISGRSGRFVALNCAALPEGLIESELFGHRKGAFTGATTDKRGLVEEADGGTLLLDEVGDMSLPAQAKLLRLLQDGTFTRVGETAGRHVDVRFVAATHRDLDSMVDQGTFRGDLFARLNGFCIKLPALRERKEDMGLLLSVFLGREWSGPTPPRMEQSAYRAFLHYDWPFNIRQLEKTVRSAVALAGDEGVINLGCLPDAVRLAVDPAPEADEAPLADGDSSRLSPEDPAVGGAATDPAAEPKRHVRRTLDQLCAELPGLLERFHGNLAEVAREMGTSRSQVYRWLQRTDIDPKLYRK